MGNFKMLGLLAVAAAALMALAGTASATTLTSPEGTPYTGTLEATSENLVIEGTFVTFFCGHSVIEAKVENHGSSEAVTGQISDLSFSGCNYEMTVKNNGSFEILSDGSFVWTGVVLTIHTSVGTCIFTTIENKLGTITGGASPALDLGPAILPRTGGNFLCGSSSKGTGSYSIATPSSLWVD